MTREGQPVIVLLSDRTVAEIILSGLLAPVLNVTPQQCEEDLRRIEQAIAARLKNGRAPPYVAAGVNPRFFAGIWERRSADRMP